VNSCAFRSNRADAEPDCDVNCGARCWQSPMPRIQRLRTSSLTLLTLFDSSAAMIAILH